MIDVITVPYVTVLASVAATSWENVIQVDMEPSNKTNFLLASLLNAISGIIILVSMQYFLIRRFIWKVKMADADRRLEEAERPLVKLYGVSFLSVLFGSWAMAISKLLASIVTNFWVWIALSRGVNLKDEIRNTCSHVGYSDWLISMNVFYSIFISIGNYSLCKLFCTFTEAIVVHVLIYLLMTSHCLVGYKNESVEHADSRQGLYNNS